ncbi:M14 family metallopeptidase [bacterium]|nr:M14 family metallopeptidase [bacterium]
MTRRILTLLILICAITNTIVNAQHRPLTRAEKSNYTETSLYSDVLNFIDQLQAITPHMRVETMGQTADGHNIPMLIIGKPVPANPLDLIYDKRSVIYFQANIHAGEVEGKEAVLMLMRDILADENPEFLDQFVILVAPIFNVDGNDKLSENNRGDNGPREAGIRYNGWNLDLNRDGMKQESPETRSLMNRLILRWDPLVLVDCHTTNGSYHDEPVTYLWGMNPNGDHQIIEYMRSKMMPEIDKHLEKKYDVLSIPYGNYIDWRKPETGWGHTSAEPRYIWNYWGLRNRFAILLENYSHADFKTRVQGNYYFLRSILDYCKTHQSTLCQMAANADRRVIQRGLNPAPTDSFAISMEEVKLGMDVTIQGYGHEEIPNARGYRRYRKTEEKKIYKAPLIHHWNKKAQVRFPFGYLIPLKDPAIIRNLIGHGIIVEKLKTQITVEVEVFMVSELKPSDPYGRGARSYQGHYMNTVKGETKIIDKTFAAGSYFIPTGQPLGNLAAYLLEPQSNDGLLLWNFFDRYLTAQWNRRPQPYPVYKLYESIKMAKSTIHELK